MLFFIFPLVIFLILEYTIIRSNRKFMASWEEMPTLSAYIESNPHAKTNNGIKGNVCGSRSIKNWGLFNAQSSLRIFSCNHCGTELYRSN